MAGFAGKNQRVALTLGLLVSAMVGLSFAAVPLYQIFCQVTGYGGTTQVAESLPEMVIDREITIRFNADVDNRLPWNFRPAQEPFTLRVGEPGLAYYVARNDGGKPLVGTAAFNVTPLKAGQYFSKVECFCFTEQLLAADESVEMPVSFFVDPAIADDPTLDDVKTITLSYTFFLDEEATAALEPQQSAALQLPETTAENNR